MQRLDLVLGASLALSVFLAGCERIPDEEDVADAQCITAGALSIDAPISAMVMFHEGRLSGRHPGHTWASIFSVAYKPLRDVRYTLHECMIDWDGQAESQGALSVTGPGANAVTITLQ